MMSLLNPVAELDVNRRTGVRSLPRLSTPIKLQMD
jgi:hypothetical protein